MTDKISKDLKTKLQAEIDEAEWAWLKPHAQRDVVVLVAPGLELAEVGVALASDSSQKVGQWIREGLVGKPTADQVTRWDAVPARRFLCLVVQPYVLMQELLTH
jgi:hypothetical protein